MDAGFDEHTMRREAPEIRVFSLIADMASRDGTAWLGM
jgi:hypothetical protein